MPQSRRPTVGSPERWRAVRLVLNQNRHQLTQAANQLYAGAAHVGTTTLLCREEWVPDRPLPLDQVALAWLTQPPAPAVTGTGDESAHVRPTEGDDRRYPAYADAIAALDPPALFENRPAYRLLAANLAQRAGRGRLDLASGRYFDGVNIGEALAHELADAWHDDLGSIAWRVLPFRELIGDPFDLARRVTIPAVTTLTIRRKNGEASFLLHWRDPAKVTHAGGRGTARYDRGLSRTGLPPRLRPLALLPPTVRRPRRWESVRALPRPWHRPAHARSGYPHRCRLRQRYL